MARLKTITAIPHVIIVDTSILWHEEKSYVVNPEFDRFWASYSKEYSMELIIPEVVRGEIIFQQTMSAKKALEKAKECIKKVNSISEIQYSLKLSENQIRKSIEKRFDAWLSSKDGIIEPLPVMSINWKALVDKAIWRLPPFTYDPKKIETEKGFRDALILETVDNAAWKPKGQIRRIFLCQDQLLSSAAKERQKLLEVFTSIDDFVSYLKLLDKEVRQENVRQLMDKASNAFYSKTNLKCLYYTDGVSEKIKSTFPHYFEGYYDTNQAQEKSPSFDFKENFWKPSNSGTFWISRSKFRDIEEGNDYVWMNDVTFVRLYRFTDDDGEYLSKIVDELEYRVNLLSFSVIWKTKVANNGKLYNLSIKEIQFNDQSFSRPTKEQKKKWNLRY